MQGCKRPKSVLLHGNEGRMYGEQIEVDVRLLAAYRKENLNKCMASICHVESKHFSLALSSFCGQYPNSITMTLRIQGGYEPLAVAHI